MSKKKQRRKPSDLEKKFYEFIGPLLADAYKQQDLETLINLDKIIFGWNLHTGMAISDLKMSLYNQSKSFKKKFELYD